MTRFPLDKNCFVTSITLAALRNLGPDLLDMDPLLVRDACQDAFNIDKMPQKMFDKLNCGLTLIGTSLYTGSIEGFLMCTAVMNGLAIDPDIASFVNLKQCAWGIWEYINLNGDIGKDLQPTETFSPDIVKYIQEVGKLNGISKFPTWMNFAEPPPMDIPDLTSDVDLYQVYMDRQQEYVKDMTAYVTARSEELRKELEELKRDGYVG